MKLFKKIFLPVLSAACVLAACAAFAACGGTGDTSDSTSTSNTSVDISSKYSADDDATNWDYKTYVIYLQLPDGTPVSDVALEICSDDNCIPTTTNEDGRATVTYTNSQQSNTVFAHFSTVLSADATEFVDYEGPDGYTLPAGGIADYNAGSETYSHVWILTEKVTTLTFVAE